MASIYRRGTTGIYQVSWIDENGLRRARSTRTTDERLAEVIFSINLMHSQ